MSPRRLDAEALRDAILAASGRLDLNPPAGSPVQKLPPNQEIGRGKNNSAGPAAAEATCRSVYLPIVRDQVPDILLVFDFADPGTLTGRREVTTVATQALLLMNSPFVTAQARAFSERILAPPAADDAARVEAAYLRAFSRVPTAGERSRALKYLGESGARAPAWASFCQALLASAEFRYLNVPPPSERSPSDVRR